ncbi:hypothetical protein VKT23_014466 [Stygiomarasmius scandens]|uniref:Heterokaryon incompatibility domain-containing protein n=1 Tax=Marasmiellus scandens TaxID=2682957 RepID=A0ABR1IZZ6_9AGAR
MRLLNTETYRVEEFYTRTDIPPYAILSHTWQKEEVTFQDIRNLEVAKTSAGWLKVERACLYARERTFEWIWIDTCCIDKSSSAELSEALNSMYQYYTDAEICYVYLSDASSEQDPRDATSRFRSSRWFTRGWTLQELLAPMYAVFLDTDWKEIGTRWSLRDVLSAITSVPIEIFEGRNDIDDFSIAQKMSWAAFRETARPEDEAYCLMGIFNVNMPPIYGEGSTKAFMRLQQEIIKISDDRSIFVWSSLASSDSEPRGLLARSPKEFWASGQVIMSKAELTEDKSSFSFGNNGLHIYLPLQTVPTEDPSTQNPIFLASLHCQRKDATGDDYLSIYLEKIGKQQYVRCYPDEVAVTSSSIKESTEVVVKETSLPRRTRRKHILAMDFDDSDAFKVHFELSSSIEHLIAINHFLRGRAMSEFHPGGIEKYSIYEQLQSLGENEGHTVMFNMGSCNDGGMVETVAIAPGLDHIILDNQWPILPADRILYPLKSGFLHIHLHMGSMQRRVVIGHGSAQECQNNQQLVPPSQGYVVPKIVILDTPYSTGRATFSLENAFPPNFFDRGLMISDYEGYSYVPSDASTPRLLTYRQSGEQVVQLQQFYLAVGFHDSESRESSEEVLNWVDVLFSLQHFKEKNRPEDIEGIDNIITDSTLKVEEVWKFYLDSGHWKTKQDSASAGIKYTQHEKHRLTATVYDTQDTNLQLEPRSHLLDVDLERLWWDQQSQQWEK